MNPLLAASLFDNPWVIGAIIIIGALVNWLAKRREENKEPEPVGNEGPVAKTTPPEFNFEETLRRFLGEEEPVQIPPQSTPLPPPPPIPFATSTTLAAIRQQQENDAVRRFKQLSEQARHPAKVVTHGRGARSGPAGRTASPWRDPRTARQAFVASIIFAPPKCMEP